MRVHRGPAAITGDNGRWISFYPDGTKGRGLREIREPEDLPAGGSAGDDDSHGEESRI